MIKSYQKYCQIKSSLYKEAPESWNRYRVKDIVDRNTYYPVGDGDHGSIKPDMYQENGIPYIRVQNLTWHGEIVYNGMAFIDENVQLANAKSILRPGDILIAKTGATIGKLGLLPDSITEANTTSSVGKVTVDKHRFNPKYILYCFQSRAIQDQIWLEASQKSAQPGFNIDDLIVFELLAPSLEEQTKIAQYLDHQTNVIDQLIKQKEKLIKLLKEKRQAVINEAVTKGLNPNATMKDSGIEWLGEVPEHWKVVQIRYLNKKVGSGVTPKGGAEVYTEEGVIFIRSQNVHFDGLRLEDVVKIDFDTHEKMSGSKVQYKDVLLNITGASIGRCCVVNIHEEMNVNQHVCIIRPSKKILPEYLNLVLQSNIGQVQVKLGTTGGNREGLTFEAIKEFAIPLPELIEQEEILYNVQSLLSRYYDLENLNVVQIDKLKEYRQSIISEAVTGKIDVRDWQPDKQNLA